MKSKTRWTPSHLAHSRRVAARPKSNVAAAQHETIFLSFFCSCCVRVKTNSFDFEEPPRVGAKQCGCRANKAPVRNMKMKKNIEGKKCIKTTRNHRRGLGLPGRSLSTASIANLFCSIEAFWWQSCWITSLFREREARLNNHLRVTAGEPAIFRNIHSRPGPTPSNPKLINSFSSGPTQWNLKNSFFSQVLKYEEPRSATQCGFS